MSEEVKSSKLAIWGLITAILCCPVGLVLSIMAMVKINKSEGRMGGQGLAIAGLVVSLVMMMTAVPMTGIMAAIAIPNFVKFQCRSKQSEAKTNLKALYIAEETHRADADTYSDDASTIGFTPRGAKMRYRYEITAAGPERFEARAVATTPDLNGDTWVIDQDNMLRNTKRGCN